jgi:MFS superfamily sulfate permease-like transporter
MTSGQTSDLHADQLPVSTATWVIIFSALLLRYVLGRFKESLPGWVIAIRVYVDALWVFLTVSFAASQDLSFFLNPTGWLAQRRIVVWFNDTRAELFHISRRSSICGMSRCWC